MGGMRLARTESNTLARMRAFSKGVYGQGAPIRQVMVSGSGMKAGSVLLCLSLVVALLAGCTAPEYQDMPDVKPTLEEDGSADENGTVDQDDGQNGTGAGDGGQNNTVDPDEEEDPGPRYVGPCDHLDVTDEGGSIVVRSEFGDDAPQGEARMEDGEGEVRQHQDGQWVTVTSASVDAQGCVAFEDIPKGDYKPGVVVFDGDYCAWHKSEKVTVKNELIFLDFVLEKDCY